MKKLTFILAISTLSLIAVSCTADDLEIQQNVNNEQMVVDDFDYTAFEKSSEMQNSETAVAREIDTIVTVPPINITTDTDPIVTEPKRD